MIDRPRPKAPIEDKYATQVINEFKKIAKKEFGLTASGSGAGMPFDVERIGVFGSVIKDLQTPTSDIDILVEFSHSVGMVKFLQLENSLEHLLGSKVDLVTRKALKKHIGQQILHEIQYVN